ncbi:MAG: hypothetical protein OXG49_00580 [Chloroflexi bacterium]|nr:hypothetical protein [Chloroflexota bacterium]
MILGKCNYCRRPIYYVLDRLEGAHGKCKRTHKTGVKKIVEKMRNFAEFGGDLQKLKSEIKAIARSSYIKDKDVGKHVFKGWESSASTMLSQGVPSKPVEKNLRDLLDLTTLPKKKLRKSEAYSNFQHLPFLRNVGAGRYPSSVANASGVNFNLVHSEKLICVFTRVAYYEQIDSQLLESHDKIVRRGLGTDSYRLKYNETFKEIDMGAMGFSTEHIYFVGRIRRFRIPYTRIALFNRDSFGISLVQDGQYPLPQQFRLEDTWFAYNLILILTRQ